MTAKMALVRRPSPKLADGIVTHIERQPIDLDHAFEQWNGYLATLENAGWELIHVVPEDSCPDGVFIEDTVVMFGNIAVLTRPGAEARRAEVASVRDHVRNLGYRFRAIEAPGTLDGGDVLKVGRTVYVGHGGRTNGQGIRQLRGILHPFGYRVIAVPTSSVLHLKSAVTALPDGTVIGYQPLVDVPSLFPHFLPVPEESGSHVVDLGEDRLLMAAGCDRSVALLRGLGYEVVQVDISEFEKLEGCVTCLSVRLRTAP
ncbi:MAG: dimethylargininase [Acidimicrobiales bacterium]